MGKKKTIREKILKYPVRKWPWKSKEKYYKWVKETYGDVSNPDMYVVGYRAWKELVWSMYPAYEPPTKIYTSAAMVAEAQQILNNAMKQVYDEHYNAGL